VEVITFTAPYLDSIFTLTTAPYLPNSARSFLSVNLTEVGVL
jgi:hypothetical protein